MHFVLKMGNFSACGKEEDSYISVVSDAVYTTVILSKYLLSVSLFSVCFGSGGDYARIGIYFASIKNESNFKNRFRSKESVNYLGLNTIWQGILVLSVNIAPLYNAFVEIINLETTLVSYLKY